MVSGAGKNEFRIFTLDLRKHGGVNLPIFSCIPSDDFSNVPVFSLAGTGKRLQTAEDLKIDIILLVHNLNVLK